MNLETPCPVCKRPVTIWTIMTAMSPSSIKCKHCNSRLSIKKEDWTFIIIAIVIGGIIGFLLGFNLMTMYLEEEMACTTAILIIVIFLIPYALIVELLFTTHLCTKSGLIAYGKRW